MSSSLSFFWDLSSASKKARIDSSVKLISSLDHFQRDWTLNVKNGVEPTSTDSLEALNAPDVVYSLKRLIRGLASPRESSRLGFAVALTQLLSTLHTIQCSTVVALLLENSQPKGSMTGQEERDVLFAQLFGFMAIVQSGLLVRINQDDNPLIAEPSDEKTFVLVVESLLALGERKSWLRESAWWALLLAIDELHASSVAWKDSAFSWLVKKVFIDTTLWPVEKLAVTLKLQQYLPQQDWKSLVSPPFKNHHLLDSSNISVISRLLKDTQSREDESGQKVEAASASWKPQLHFIWDILLDRLLKNPESHDVRFQEFFRTCVDESLFSNNTSLQRKYWGFLVFQKALPIIDPAQGAQLLTPNLMRTWINHLSKKDRNLHNLAIQVANDVQAFVKQHPSTGLAFVTELDRGNVPFDRLTKSNTIQSILGSMDADGIKQHLESILADAYEKPSTVEPKLLESRMRRICDQASSLIHNGSVPKRDDWIEMVLHFFVVNGVLLCKKSPSSVKVIKSDLTTPETQKICRETLLKTLGDLNAQSLVPSSRGKTPANRAQGLTSDFQSWTSKIMSDILVWKEDPRVISTFDSVNDKIVMKAMKEAQSLRKKKKLDSKVEKGATLLLDGLILEKLASKEDKDEEIDEALKACTESASQLRKNNDNKSTGELSPHTDVLLDIIIGFMEKATAFGRSLAKLVFLNLTSEMTSDSVDLLIAQLERKTAEELMDVDDEENDQENIDEESDEEESSSESADDGSAEEEMDDEEAAKLRLELERVLKTGTDALDPENSSDEEEEFMDDDQMMAMDEQLTQVFQSRMSSSGRKSAQDQDLQREATHFKNRVLDLVDLFVRNEPTSPLLLSFILPLVDLATQCSSDERQLADKAKGILRNRICKSKEIPSDIDVSTPLQKVHQLARHARDSETLALLSETSVFLVKTSKNPKLCAGEYQTSIEDFATRKNSSLNPAFFQIYIKRFPEQAWQLRTNVMPLVSQSVNGYRASQTLQLVLFLLQTIDSPDISELTLLLSDVESAVSILISRSAEDEVHLTTQQAKELLKACSSVARKYSKTGGWKPVTWIQLAETFRKSSQFEKSPVLPEICLRLAKSLETPESEGKPAVKRKLEKADSASRKRKKA